MRHHYSLSVINSSLSLLFVVFVTTACAKNPPPPPQVSSVTDVREGVPGSITVNSVEVSASVTAIDTKNRKLTLLLPDGDKEKVMVPPEVVNFDQIEVGDLVKANLTESLVIYLDREDALNTDNFASGIALAPKGAKPGAVIAGTVKVTATVTAIDQSQRTATLSFDDGTIETFPVRDDIDLSKRKVGEKVVFITTEVVALSVQKS